MFMLLVEKQKRESQSTSGIDNQFISVHLFKKKKKKLCSDNKEKDQPKISKQENKMAEGMDQCRFCLVPKKRKNPRRLKDG